MTRFFTADLHFGHENIIRYTNRPYASVSEMNAALIDNWNSVVSPDDEVWVLGDVALGRIAETLPLVTELAGHKHLAPGNHDRCWPYRRNAHLTDLAMYTDVGFEVHDPEVTLSLGIRQVRLCHFPTTGDSRSEDRYASCRPTPQPEEWLLHGHVHNQWQFLARQVNVGVDVWNYRPVSEVDINSLIWRHEIVWCGMRP